MPLIGVLGFVEVRYISLLPSCALLASCCGAPTEMPSVAVPIAVLACPTSQFGVEAIEVTNAGDRVAEECGDSARRQGCKGSISFVVDVSAAGISSIREIDGFAGPALRACLRAAVSRAALGPATDCRGTLIDAQAPGHLFWDMGEVGISSQLANVGAVIPALDPSCVTALDKSR